MDTLGPVILSNIVLRFETPKLVRGSIIVFLFGSSIVFQLGKHSGLLLL